MYGLLGLKRPQQGEFSSRKLATDFAVFHAHFVREKQESKKNYNSQFWKFCETKSIVTTVINVIIK